MIKKTKEYDIFNFRSDNREKINQDHVKRLIQSISSRNLLELRPILVNEDMEVLDGQHRLMAAKSLGVDIYYQVEKILKDADIILMNTSKSWGSADYQNYYCRNGFIEYIKLEEFRKKNSISLRISLNICIGRSRGAYENYKKGRFVFKQEEISQEIDCCKDTIELIHKLNGFSPYTKSARFWKALLKLVKHHRFEHKKWMINLHKMVERFVAKAKTEDYCKLMMEIYNWHNSDKINICDEEFVA